MFSIAAHFTLTAVISILWLGCEISLTEIPEIALSSWAYIQVSRVLLQ